MTTSAVPAPTTTSLSQVFDDWQRAGAALRTAESRGACDDEVLPLAEAVLRTRVAVLRDRIAAGWQPSDEMMRDLEVDTQLMLEADARGT
ncbi:MAG TPA: hypothetical protein VII50_07670 [Acidothermaceae bacterium]